LENQASVLSTRRLNMIEPLFEEKEALFKTDLALLPPS
jgi:hypothetical protein